MSHETLRIDGTHVFFGDGPEIDAHYPVKKAWHLEKDNCIILLMDYTAKPSTQQFRNLVIYSLENRILCEAELPTASGSDAYVDAEFRNDVLRGFSFSCFSCVINVTTGRIIEKTFSK